MDFTRHSVSTKIADSLASGIPLFAYAPKELASTAHLLRNNCAIPATSQEALKPALQEALENEQLCTAAAERGLATAAAFHDRTHTGMELRKTLECVLREVHNR